MPSKNSLLPTCILLLHLTLTQETLPPKTPTTQIKFNKLNLLNLSTHWSGYGTSILYPKTLKILTKKLASQSGLFTTNTPLPGGVNWAINYNFTLECQNSSKNAGIGMFLSFNNVNMSSADYNGSNQSGLFGFPKVLDGLGVVFKGNELRVGMFRKQHLEESDVFNYGKVCKEFLNRRNGVMVKVKYTQGSVLGVYTYDEKMKEKLCVQFTDVVRYQSFYLSVSGRDREGQCDAEMEEMTFYTHEPIQIIPIKDKKKGDPFFAYFEKSKISEHNENWKRQQRHFKEHKENGKLMASRLLDFADFSENDFYHRIKQDLKIQIVGVDVSLEVLEREAKTMQNFSQQLVQARKNTKNNIEDVFGEMLDFLNQVDGTYEEVEKSTQEVFDLVNSIKLPDHLLKIFNKTEKISKRLEKFLYNKDKFMKDSRFDSLRLEKVQKVQNFLGKLYEMDKHKKNNLKKKSSSKNKNDLKQIRMKKIVGKKLMSFRFIGTFILGTIGGAILIGFLVMYLKIRKAIRHKQIL